MTAPNDPTRLVVAASTFPARPGDGTPSFVRDLSLVLGRSFETVVVVPRVAGGARRERDGELDVHRFRYFPKRWEDLCDGAILENLRARPTRWIQAPAFIAAETVALARAVRRCRPDVLHLHWMIPQGLVALIAARRVPWLLTVHGADLYALSGRPFGWFKRRVLRRAAVITVMNVEMRDRVVAMGIDPAKVVVAPMGADIAGLDELAGHPDRDPRRLLFVGRLVEKKGVRVLLDALRSLPPDLGWRLDIAGDGPLRAELESAARGLAVTFHGQVDRAGLVDLLRHCGIVVIPSVRAASGDQDGRPVVVAEALAAGRCVVASGLPGIDEVIVSGQDGVLVPPGDHEALATVLKDLLCDPERVARFGAAGARRAEALSVDAVGAQYRDLAVRAAQRRRPTAM